VNQELQPTYVTFLDKLLGGGTAPTGVYGILGPTGIGKTHLASMIASNGATHGSISEDACRNSLPWVLFDIETGRADSQQRILSHCAKVKRENVRNGHSEIQSYEQARLSELLEMRGRFMSERERHMHARNALECRLRLICQDDLLQESEEYGLEFKFTDFPKWIAECIDEIGSGTRLGGIVIDGVNNVWNYSQESTSMSEREFIQDFVDNFCRELSFTEQCPVWVTHQVNGTACDASPLAPLSHQDAARCKTFASSLDACFVLGSPSEDTVFAIQCTKRQSDSAKLDRLLLTFDEDFATIVEAEDYIEDKHRQTFKQRPQGNSLLDQDELENLNEMVKQSRRRGTP
jgi:RecA/RadA recombinase